MKLLKKKSQFLKIRWRGYKAVVWWFSMYLYIEHSNLRFY